MTAKSKSVNGFKIQDVDFTPPTPKTRGVKSAMDSAMEIALNNPGRWIEMPKLTNQSTASNWRRRLTGGYSLHAVTPDGKPNKRQVFVRFDELGSCDVGDRI